MAQKSQAVLTFTQTVAGDTIIFNDVLTMDCVVGSPGGNQYQQSLTANTAAANFVSGLPGSFTADYDVVRVNNVVTITAKEYGDEYELNPVSIFNDMGSVVVLTSFEYNVDCTLSGEAETTFANEGQTDGTITVTPSGGVAPYVYQIDGGTGQSSNYFDGLEAGTYEITITDSEDCEYSFSVEIIELTCFDPLTLSRGIPYRFIYNKCDPDEEVPDNVLFEDQTVPGINTEAFYQILRCSDLLTLQIYYEDDVYNSRPVLNIRNKCDGNLITTVDFVELSTGSPETANNYWQLEANVSDLGICGEVVYFEIVSYSSTSPETQLYVHATSEPVHVKSSFENDLLIKYYNDTDYAGIKYEDVSYINHLRIRAQFWKERQETSEEVYRKSDNELVKLEETQTDQRFLETDYLPSYLHKKLALALSHDHVQIDYSEWVREEKYEWDYPNRYQLARGEVWLTHKTDYFKNII